MKRAYFRNSIADENLLMRVPPKNRGKLSGHLKTNYSRMKPVIFFILLFALTNSLKSQTMVNGLLENYRFKKLIDGVTLNTLKLSDIQGTPYLKEEYNQGKVVTSEGTTYENISMRYNAFSDDLEFKKGADCYNFDPKSIVKRAEFGGAIFSCMTYGSEDKTKSGFFEILTEGKATLLTRYTIKYLEKEKVQPFVDPQPARFDKPKKEYYLSFGGLPAKLITTKKSFLELFGSQKDEMDAYISKNKLSIREEGELIKIVAYFNSLSL